MPSLAGPWCRQIYVNPVCRASVSSKPTARTREPLHHHTRGASPSEATCRELKVRPESLKVIEAPKPEAPLLYTSLWAGGVGFKVRAFLLKGSIFSFLPHCGTPDFQGFLFQDRALVRRGSGWYMKALQQCRSSPRMALTQHSRNELLYCAPGPPNGVRRQLRGSATDAGLPGSDTLHAFGLIPMARLSCLDKVFGHNPLQTPF